MLLYPILLLQTKNRWLLSSSYSTNTTQITQVSNLWWEFKLPNDTPTTCYSMLRHNTIIVDDFPISIAVCVMIVPFKPLGSYIVMGRWQQWRLGSLLSCVRIKNIVDELHIPLLGIWPQQHMRYRKLIPHGVQICWWRNTHMIKKPRLVPNQYGFSRANAPLKPSSHHLFNTPCTCPHIAPIVLENI